MRRMVGTAGLVAGVSTSLVVEACSFSEHELLRDEESPSRGVVGGTLVAGDERCRLGSGSAVVGPSNSTIGELTEPERRPPALCGGTLIASSDGRLLLLADPHHDRLYVVDLSDQYEPELIRELLLPRGAEPGRLVREADGTVSVTLHGTCEELTIDIATMEILDKRPLREGARGVAQAARGGALRVA